MLAGAGDEPGHKGEQEDGGEDHRGAAEGAWESGRGSGERREYAMDDGVGFRRGGGLGAGRFYAAGGHVGGGGGRRVGVDEEHAGLVEVDVGAGDAEEGHGGKANGQMAKGPKAGGLEGHRGDG